MQRGWNGGRWLGKEQTLGIKERTNVGAERRGDVQGVEEGWSWMNGFGFGHEVEGQSVDGSDRGEGMRRK